MRSFFIFFLSFRSHEQSVFFVSCRIGKPYSLDQLTEALKVLVLSIAETARAT